MASSSILFVVFTILASIWTVQGNVVYTRDGSVLCDVCPPGSTTYTERRYITQPSLTYSPPYYNVQGRALNNPSSLLSHDNTITQQTFYDTVDSKFLIFLI